MHAYIYEEIVADELWVYLLPVNSLVNALALAVRHGWLAEGSCTECLVVPGHAIQGPDGDPNKPCPVHVRKNLRKRRPELRVVE